MDPRELVEAMGRSEQTDLAIRIQAKEDAKKRVLDDPSTANLAALDKATRMLDEFKAKSAPASAERCFKDKMEVLRFLLAEGYDCSKSSLYRHADKGLLACGPSGGYPLSNVLAYVATAGLKRSGEAAAADAEAFERLKEKEREELRKLRAQAGREELKLARESGELIPRAEVYLQLAARASVLESGLKQAVELRAAELVHLVGGSPDRVDDLIGALETIVDDALTDYADGRTLLVEFADMADGPEGECEA